AIYIAAWGLTPDLLLVRGKHHRAGPDGSPEQEELLAWLSAKGLSEEELHFWQNCEELSVKNVLSYAVSKGVDVRVLLWNTYTLPFMTGPKQVQETLEEVGVLCLLDDSHLGLLNHPLTAHHQKTVVVDGRCAFVGGIDMMMENNGDHDRWDTKGHPYQHLLRLGKNEFMPHSWHDVHMLFEGSAVFDVEHNFLQRWNAVVELHEMKPELYVPEPQPADASAALESDIRIQVTRTIPDRTYPFAGDGIATILETYQKAFAQAKRSIYIENQYFWRRTFLGLENPLLGPPHPDMEQLLQTLAGALSRGVVLTLVLPDNPNVGREFTDDGLNYLWEIAPKAVASGTLHVYTLGTSLRKEDHVLYRPIYVHGKVAIVDDEWMTVGSANLNNR
ncbi:MAG TPA: phospholipase D family protein, partial [Ktedonobacteraceae bacterium]|nr:phospholipase D family protein [Ktedonobacteraceae bacterium]